MAIEKKTVTASGSYGAADAPDIVFTIEPKKVTFFLDDSGTGKSVTISADGVNDHIHLHTDHSILSYESLQRCKHWWVKGAGSAGLIAIAES